MENKNIRLVQNGSLEEAKEFLLKHDEITPEEHVYLSGLVDRTDYGDGTIEGRMKENLELMLRSFVAFVKASNQMDLLVKRTIYYGTGPESTKFKEKQAVYAKTEAYLESAIEEIIAGKDTFTGNADLSKVLHYSMGTGTEAGEIIEALLKYMHKGELDLTNVGEEYGDVNWYQSRTHAFLGMSYEGVMARNVKKLILKRYADGGFSEKQALNRDTASERTLLEDKEASSKNKVLDAVNALDSSGETKNHNEQQIREDFLEMCLLNLFKLINIKPGFITSEIIERSIDIHNNAEILVRKPEFNPEAHQVREYALELAIGTVQDLILEADHITEGLKLAVMNEIAKVPRKSEESSSSVELSKENKSFASIAEAEKASIELAVTNSNGNLQDAARSLGIGRATLYRKMKEYSLLGRKKS